jgi:hypothetical protein
MPLRKITNTGMPTHKYINLRPGGAIDTSISPFPNHYHHEMYTIVDKSRSQVIF